MKISEGLKFFLSAALIKTKRDRFIGFLSNNKGHIKFARSLDHDLIKSLNTDLFVKKISENEMTEQGDLYCSNGVTNNSESSMVDLYGKAPWDGGWLLISKSGKIAIHRPEGRIDDEIHIKL